MFSCGSHPTQTELDLALAAELRAFADPLLGIDRHHNRYYSFASRPKVYCFDHTTQQWTWFVGTLGLHVSVASTASCQFVTFIIVQALLATFDLEDERDFTLKKTLTSRMTNHVHNSVQLESSHASQGELGAMCTTEALIELARNEVLDFSTKVTPLTSLDLASTLTD